MLSIIFSFGGLWYLVVASDSRLAKLKLNGLSAASAGNYRTTEELQGVNLHHFAQEFN